MADRSGSIVLVGAGGHARVVADALQGRVVGFVAPRPTSPVPPGIGEWMGGDDEIPALAAEGCTFAVGLGFVDVRGAAHRADVLTRLRSVDLATVVHPSAVVSASSELGPGSFVGPGAIVGPGVVLGAAAIVNSGAVVDHDCRVGANVHIATGASVAGDVVIGDDTLVGVGASVRQRTTIGSRAVVGAGAVVIRDVDDGIVVAGVPAVRLHQLEGEP